MIMMMHARPTRSDSLLAGLAVLAIVGLALGQPAPPVVEQSGPNAARQAERSGPVSPSPMPPSPQAVDQLLDAAFLTPDQRKDKRIQFGRYTAEDLDTPARVARAALIRGAYDDPSLVAGDADPLDRAEAALRRGDFDAMFKDLGDIRTPRASRLRVEAFDHLSKYDDATKEAKPVIDDLLAGKLKTADDIAEGVRILAIRTRLRGPAQAGGSPADYGAMMQLLADARTRLDRFAWPVILAEAELLYEKDNRSQAAEAMEQALALNPTSADAWTLLGRLTVDSFNFGSTERIARRLDLLAGDWSGADPEDPGESLPGSVSPLAAKLIARTQLRQSEGKLALEVLEPALTKYPNMPELLALKCAAEAVGFDFAASDSCLEQFDRAYGRSPMAHLAVGSALSEARQYERSRKHLLEAARRQPMDAEPHITLGLMLLQAGDDAGALTALEKSFKLDPFNVRADNSLRLARELQAYERVETPHYVIRYKPGKRPDGTAGDELLACEMAGPLEANHDAVTGKPEAGVRGGIDHVPAQKTIIDLMPDHQWFGVRIAGMPAIHTIAASTGPVIAMESPREGPKHQGSYDWVRVLRHEYVHTVTLSRTSNRIPHWFTEASAVFLENAPRDFSTVQLLTGVLVADKLFDFTDINIAFVRPRRPSDRSQAYAQGHWMYEYICARFGERAPLDLMDKYAAGVREEEAFSSVLGIGRTQFFEDFKKWARNQVVEWGMLPPEGDPTLKALLARQTLTKPDLEPERRSALERIASGKEEENDEDVELVEATPELVKSLLEAHPRHPDVLELAVDDAVKAAGGKASPDMVPLIERYARARPVDPKPHRLLARMYLEAAGADASQLAAQAAAAIPHLEFLDAREQKSPTLAMELARRHAAIGDMDKAKLKAERATQLSPFDPRPRELAATIALQRKDVVSAERHIVALTKIEPDREIHARRLEALGRMKAATPLNSATDAPADPPAGR